MSRTAGEWKLPQPTDIKEEEEWVSIPRIARTVPFGYELDKDDSDKCRRRYSCESDILNGIAEYIKMVKYFEKVSNESSDNR